VRGELPFSRTTLVLERRARLFTELRQALRLRTKPDAILPSPHASPEDLAELQDIKKSVKKLTTSLRRRRPERGPAQDTREAIDVALAHLERHGPSLFGQIVSLLSLTDLHATSVQIADPDLLGHGALHKPSRCSGTRK